MRRTIFILGLSLFFMQNITKAQLKVKSDGRVYINGFRSADDYNNELCVIINNQQ